MANKEPITIEIGRTMIPEVETERMIKKNLTSVDRVIIDGEGLRQGKFSSLIMQMMTHIRGPTRLQEVDKEEEIEDLEGTEEGRIDEMIIREEEQEGVVGEMVVEEATEMTTREKNWTKIMLTHPRIL